MNEDWQAYHYNLAGSWKLDRHISNGDRFEGAAEFERIEPNSLLLTERGTLLLKNGSTLPATRQWRWNAPNGKVLSIHYADTPARLYHQLNLSERDNAWEASADHLCGDDIYAGNYKFTDDRFKIEQTITGPQKNLRVHSRYTRSTAHSK